MTITEGNLSWSEFDEIAANLAAMIKASGQCYDAIIGIARGGLFLAGYLSYHLGIKSLYVINTKLYENNTIVAPQILYYPEDIRIDNVLVVDDILDTGSTYQLLKELLAQTAKSISWAVLIDKGKTEIVIDYVGHKLPEEVWVHFPWNP